MQPLKSNQEVEIIDSKSPYWKRRGQVDDLTDSMKIISGGCTGKSNGVWIRFAEGKVVPFKFNQIKKVKY